MSWNASRAGDPIRIWRPLPRRPRRPLSLPVCQLSLPRLANSVSAISAYGDGGCVRKKIEFASLPRFWSRGGCEHRPPIRPYTPAWSVASAGSSEMMTVEKVARLLPRSSSYQSKSSKIYHVRPPAKHRHMADAQDGHAWPSWRLSLRTCNGPWRRLGNNGCARRLGCCRPGGPCLSIRRDLVSNSPGPGRTPKKPPTRELSGETPGKTGLRHAVD
jgi:hypothetical protein